MDNYKIMNEEDFNKLYSIEDDPWSIGDATNKYCYEDILKLLKSYTPANTIFDVGCGLGAFTNRLSHLASRTVGFDISSVAVEKAKKRFPHLEFQNLDLAKDIPHEQADIVVAHEVLYYQDTCRRISMLENLFKISKKYVLFGYYILNNNEDLLYRWITFYFNPIIKIDLGHILLFCEKRII